MIQIVFKNLENSQLLRKAGKERIKDMIEKFPDLVNHKITLTLEMENSTIKTGSDVFRARIHINGVKYHHIVLDKEAPQMYKAIALLFHYLLERLNRYGDKERVKRIARDRRSIYMINSISSLPNNKASFQTST